MKVEMRKLVDRTAVLVAAALVGGGALILVGGIARSAVFMFSRGWDLAGSLFRLN